MTVKELVEYSARFFGLNDYQKRLDVLSQAWDLDLSRNIQELSTGNKKKVSIVQSILHRPELLILDEPTSGLDPLIQSSFYEILKAENKQGMTIFFSSHVLSEVQKLCNRVAIIRHGKIVKLETMENLKKNMLKRVHLTSHNDTSLIKNFAGVIGWEEFDGHCRFMFKGSISDLVGALNQIKIENLSIEEPDLDEIFLHYYSNSKN